MGANKSVKFRVSTDDDDRLGLLCNENYLAVKWLEGPIYFSFCERGNAIMMHFAAGKKGLRHVKKAYKEFIEWIFDSFDWCKMVMAYVEKKRSLERLVRKCGGKFLLEINGYNVYMRLRA